VGIYKIRGDHNIVRRCIGWDAPPNRNSKIFFLPTGSTNNLIEDCAGWGTARKIVGRHEEGDNTVRRFFFRWTGLGEGVSQWCIGLTTNYKSHGTNITENCIGTWDETGYDSYSGLSKWAIFGYDGQDPDGGNLYGNIAYLTKAQTGGPRQMFSYQQNFYVENSLAYSERDNVNMFVSSKAETKYLTAVGGGTRSPARYDSALYVSESRSGSAPDMSHAIVQDFSGYAVNRGSLVDYLMLHNNSSGHFARGTSASYVESDPSLLAKCGNLLQYGLAEADRPQVDGEPVGAQIQYRYVDGVLTDEPLWPWPMNERIEAAMVQSGYDQKGGLDGRGATDLTRVVFELGGGTMPDFGGPEPDAGTVDAAPDAAVEASSTPGDDAGTVDAAPDAATDGVAEQWDAGGSEQPSEHAAGPDVTAAEAQGDAGCSCRTRRPGRQVAGGVGLFVLLGATGVFRRRRGAGPQEQRKTAPQ
jgi:hypothetical protein